MLIGSSSAVKRDEPLQMSRRKVMKAVGLLIAYWLDEHLRVVDAMKDSTYRTPCEDAWLESLTLRRTKLNGGKVLHQYKGDGLNLLVCCPCPFMM